MCTLGSAVSRILWSAFLLCLQACRLTTIYLCDIPACLTGMNDRHTLFCLASSRVYLFMPITRHNRTLLPHVFTLTHTPFSIIFRMGTPVKKRYFFNWCPIQRITR